MPTTWTSDSPPPIYGLDVDYEQSWTHERPAWLDHNRTALAGNNKGCIFTGLGIVQHQWKPYKLTGVAVDSNESPVVGATVYLLRGDFRAFSIAQVATSEADGSYLFYIDNPDDEWVILSWFYDVGLGENVRGVTDRNLKAVAS